MYPRRDLLALSGAVIAAGIAGCLGELPGTGPETTSTPLRSTLDRETAPDVPPEDLDALVRDNAAFGLALHGYLVDQDPWANLFTSPFSVSVALAMTYAGARGTTASRMADTLNFELPEDRLHPAFNALDGRLPRDGDGADADDGSDATPFALRTANSLWGQTEYPFADAFLDVLARQYGAGLRTLDFADAPDDARGTINDWVAERTDGTIEDLLPEGVVTTTTRLVLANAVHFEANWASTFDEEATGDASFTGLDGSTATVPMMRQTSELPHGTVDGTQVVELPYVGGDVGMVLILPPEDEFDRVERSLHVGRLSGFFDALETKRGVVELPRFTFGSNAGLREALSALGMPEAFDPNAADFGGMTDPSSAGEDLYVEDVAHRTHVAVDEQGTEASAATGAVVGYTSLPSTEFEFVADRPFLLVIRHRATDAVLFLGRVVDGEAARP